MRYTEKPIVNIIHKTVVRRLPDKTSETLILKGHMNTFKTIQTARAVAVIKILIMASEITLGIKTVSAFLPKTVNTVKTEVKNKVNNIIASDKSLNFIPPLVLFEE